MKKSSISYKLSSLFLSILLAALILMGSLCIWNLYIMKETSLTYNLTLGRTAAEDTEEALEKLAGQQLLGMAKEKAAYIDEKLATIRCCLNGIVQVAEEIYQNPQAYPDREVPLPIKDSRELAIQLLWSEKLIDYNKEAISIPEPTKELLKLGNLQELLVQYNNNNDMISSTYLATRSGWMLQADYIAYSKYSDDALYPDFYEADSRQWYQRAQMASKGEIVYSDIMSDIHEGKECIVCAAPVYAKGEVVAVAGIGTYLDVITQVVQNTVIGKTGYAILIDKDAQIKISDLNSEETMGNAREKLELQEDAGEVQTVLENIVTYGESGLKRVQLKEREVYLAYAPLKELELSFVVVMDVEEVIAPARQSQEEILLLTDEVAQRQGRAIQKTQMLFWFIMLAAGLIIGCISILATKRLLKPIQILTKRVAQIDVESLEQPIHISSGDEIEELANAFNEMTKQIQKDIRDLANVTAEKERIRTEIEVAARIQADMLPKAEKLFADRTDFGIAAAMVPAKGVGGDFYDFFLLGEDCLVLVMADVAGKGVPAALFMVVSRTLIRTHLMAEGQEGIRTQGLSHIVEEINNHLCANNQNGMFVTAWIGVITLSTGELTFVNAGHCPPLLRYRNSTCAYENTFGGLMLAGMEKTKYTQSQISLQPGDMLFLYTDGVTEATSTCGELYGEERLCKLVEGSCINDRHSDNKQSDDNHSKDIHPKDILEHIWRDVDAFWSGAEQFDDITMLAFTYQGNHAWKRTGEPHIQQIGIFAEFVAKKLKEEQVSIENFAIVQMAFDEIFSNICYYSNATEVTVGIQVKKQQRAIILYFEDNGVYYNPLERPDPDIEQLPYQKKLGGMGIYLVKKQMDELKYEYFDNKNHFTIIKYE